MNSVIENAGRFTEAKMAVDYSFFFKGTPVSVRYTRTVRNIEGKPEDLFNVWIGSGEKYPSELFARALSEFK